MQKEKKEARAGLGIRLPKARRPVSVSEFRSHVSRFWDTIEKDNRPVTVKRRGHGSMVMVSESYWSGLEETLYLMSSKANWDAIQEGLKEARDWKNLPRITPEELRERGERIHRENAK